MKSLTVLIIAFLGVVLAPSVCQARLGETMEQCIKRYGASELPKDTPAPSGVVGDSIAEFKKDGYTIDVTFLHGVVGFEMIAKGSSPMPDTDKKMFLDSEAGGSTWTKLPKEEDDERYARADGNAFADYAIGACYFEFQSKAYRDAQQAKTDADAKDKLHGF